MPITRNPMCSLKYFGIQITPVRFLIPLKRNMPPEPKDMRRPLPVFIIPRVPHKLIIETQRKGSIDSHIIIEFGNSLMPIVETAIPDDKSIPPRLQKGLMILRDPVD